jgi:hypothetical protein
MARKPKYPIYIISKGRYEVTLTADCFEQSGIDYLVAVEPQEFDLYAAKLREHRLLKLPFSNLGLGSYPARNYCWEHAKQAGFTYHWLFDDNIRGLAKWQDGKKQYVKDQKTGLVFVEQYITKNQIDIGGFEYRYFSSKPPKYPFKHNCHIYSALLIKNILPYRWRLKYNEDVDLCLQVLHNGGTTASCVYYLTNKTSTLEKQKGGNQTELYKGNAREKKILKAKMLEAVWPQYAKTVIRFNRPHHFVDWKVFSKTSKRVPKTVEKQMTNAKP